MWCQALNREKIKTSLNRSKTILICIHNPRRTVLYNCSRNSSCSDKTVLKDLQTFRMTVMYKLPQLVQRKASKKAQWYKYQSSKLFLMNQHTKTAEMHNALHKKLSQCMHKECLIHYTKHRFAMFFNCVPTIRQTFINFVKIIHIYVCALHFEG